MKAFDAAQVLFKNGEKNDALAILRHLWVSKEKQEIGEFRLFSAWVEVSASFDPAKAAEFLEQVFAGSGDFYDFWTRRSLSEQAVLLDWHGQILISRGDAAQAFESLSRAASLGRDTSLLWRQLASIYIENKDLELGMRYMRRSLQLFRQLDFSLVAGRDYPMGWFGGVHPLGTRQGLEAYLQLLLQITRLAKSQRNLKAVRELVVEMIHQFSKEPRLPKIRLMMERAIVDHSLRQADGHVAQSGRMSEISRLRAKGLEQTP